VVTDPLPLPKKIWLWMITPVMILLSVFITEED
jgi:hypothetical protein